MVDALHAIVRHLTIVLVRTLVRVLVIAEIGQVYLLHQVVNVLRTKLYILVSILLQAQMLAGITCQQRGLLDDLIDTHTHEVEVKQPPSVFQRVKVATMFDVMLPALRLVFAFLDFEFA